jgi:hypothetical protein
MLMKERFKLLQPEIAKIRRKVNEREGVYWEVYDEEESLLGYAFYAVVPESAIDIPEAEEFDKYEVTGIVDKIYKISALDISEHPDRTEDLWAVDIVEPPYGRQYLGLPPEKIRLAPDGDIDAITESTLSSKLITEAIREKVEHIMLGPAE